MKLPVQLPLVKQVAERHQPHFALRAMQERHTDKDQTGKQLGVVYPFYTFFPSSSL